MSTASAHDGASGARSGSYKWYVVVVLLVIYSLKQLDRSVINILAESIKLDLGISDTQLGLLTGTAFAVLYGLVGLPIARLADRTNRVNLIAIACLTWSGLTALCGFAQSFVQLFVLRVGVGIGEAGATPPSQSLIADYFPHQRRSTAVALYNTGVTLGTFLGLLLGGFVNEIWGWRAAFMIAGVPGIVMLVVLKLTVREPVRGAVDGLEESARTVPPIGQTVRELLSRKSYIRIVTAAVCAAAVTFSTGAWMPALFIRLHGFTSAEIGGWLALFTLGGICGSLGGGALADYLKRRTPLAEIYVPIAGACITFPSVILACLARDPAIALIGLAGVSTFGYVWIGPTSAMIHRAVPVRSRALSIGFMLFLSSLTGGSLGPPLVGAASDLMRPTFGADSLRYALACAPVMYVFSIGLYLWAGRFFLADARKNEGAAEAAAAGA